MQHISRKQRLALFLGGAFLASGAVVIAACSSDNGDTPVPTQADANNPSNPPDGAVPEGGNLPDGGGTDADCSKAPKLHNATTGFYCSFFTRDGGAEAGDGGVGPKNCANADTCCNPADDPPGTHQTTFCAEGPAKGETQCMAKSAQNGVNWIDGGSVWECADKASCGGAADDVCCLIQDPDRLPKTLNIGDFPKDDKDVPPACGAKRSYNEGGTRCRKTSCPLGEQKLCSLNDDNCGAGTKCTPFRAFSYRDLGYCL